jgi:hypothetical protein
LQATLIIDASRGQFLSLPASGTLCTPVGA